MSKKSKKGHSKFELIKKKNIIEDRLEKIQAEEREEKIKRNKKYVEAIDFAFDEIEFFIERLIEEYPVFIGHEDDIRDLVYEKIQEKMKREHEESDEVDSDVFLPEPEELSEMLKKAELPQATLQIKNDE